MDLDEVEPEKWILSQDWTNPWLSGERFHRVVSSYLLKKGGSVDLYKDVKLNQLFEAYEHYVHDSATGMPIKGGCKDPSYAMSGLFKAVRANFESGRRVPDMERAVDLTAETQCSCIRSFRKNETTFKRVLTMIILAAKQRAILMKAVGISAHRIYYYEIFASFLYL